jgi:hypothetical protein
MRAFDFAAAMARICVLEIWVVVNHETAIGDTFMNPNTKGKVNTRQNPVILVRSARSR